jgi:hypothetical protein
MRQLYSLLTEIRHYVGEFFRREFKGSIFAARDIVFYALLALGGIAAFLPRPNYEMAHDFFWDRPLQGGRIMHIVLFAPVFNRSAC